MVYAKYMVKKNYGTSERKKKKVIRIPEEDFLKDKFKTVVAKNISNLLIKDLITPEQFFITQQVFLVSTSALE